MTTEPIDRAEALKDEATRLRNRMVMDNQGLVYQVARAARRGGHGIPLADLVQFGNIGLVRAAEKFEPERGLRFSTYAVYWIRQAVFKGIANTARPIRVPLHARKEAAAVRACAAAMERETGRTPWPSEALDAMEARGEVTPARRGRLLRAAEAEVAKFGVKPLEEVPLACRPGDGPFAAACAAEHREQFDRALPLLGDDARRVLEGRYGLDGSEPAPVATVAAGLGVDWHTARRLEREAIRDLARLLHPASA